MDNIKQLFDTNTFGILRVCQAVVSIMAKRRSGTIVNIGLIRRRNVRSRFVAIFYMDILNHLTSSTP